MNIHEVKVLDERGTVICTYITREHCCVDLPGWPNLPEDQRCQGFCEKPFTPADHARLQRIANS